MFSCPALYSAANNECDRSRCRIVRHVINRDLLPSYKAAGVKIPYKCPFFKDRDKYVVQEDHKEQESASRWSCGYCGKAFIGETYLDGHLANRHADSIYTAADSVCLEDMCEIFRCDILSGVANPTFWDVALCLEEDMVDLTQDCYDLMENCLPENLGWNTTKNLKAALTKSVCSFLTCKKYYDFSDTKQGEDAVGVPYIVLTILLSVAMIIYYCVAVNYFWLDTFSDVPDYEDSDRMQLTYSKNTHSARGHRNPKKHINQTEALADRELFQTHLGLDATIQKIEHAETS